MIFKTIYNKVKRSLFTKILLVIAVIYLILIHVNIKTFFSITGPKPGQGPEGKRGIEARRRPGIPPGLRPDSLSRSEMRDRRFGKILEDNIYYTSYIISDIGTPPDTGYAQKLADSLNIKMKIKTPEFTWQSHKDFPQFDLEKLHTAADKNARVGFDKGLKVCQKRGDIEYYFAIQSPEGSIPRIFFKFVLRTLIYAFIAVAIIYIALRFLLKPIRKLHNAVEQISQGNLEYKIDTKRSDEFGLLIKSFNEMREKVVDMIKAREQLLLDVSHELRSPLTRMKLSLAILDDNEEKQDMIDDVKEMETMINVILENSRLHSENSNLTIENIDIIKLLRDVAQSFMGQAPGINLQDLPEEKFLEVDKDRFRMLLRNIFSNAIKYSGEKSKPVQVQFEEDDENLTIIVRDSGCGIPKDELPYIFEPFYRVDKSRSKETGGFGLGMSLCKNIMEAHGGKIWLESRVDEGTVVFLEFCE